ncbi:MAG: sensor histidine kinase [Eubacteriales bacterium]|nr:sensor histidine kinase [Eubacteriales bacterium]
MKMLGSKIRYKLVLAVLLILLLSLSLVTVISNQKSLSVIREQSSVLNASLAQMGAEQLSAAASQINTIYQSIYLDSEFRDYLKSLALSGPRNLPVGYTDQLKSVFLSRLSSRTDIYSIIYIDPLGRLTYCTRDEAGHYEDYENCGLPEDYTALYESLDTWQRGLKMLPTAKHMALRSKAGNKAPLVYAAARKIVNTESHYEPVGVMYITMDLSTCAHMAQTISADSTTLVYVVDQNGSVIYDSSGSRTGQSAPKSLAAYFSEGRNDPLLSIERTTYVIAHSEVASFGWRVVTLVPEEVYAKEAYSVSDAILLSAIAVLTLAAALTTLFSRILSRPLERMAQTMNRVDSEHLSIRAAVSGHDEVSQMARSFNELMDRLQTAIQNEYLLEIRHKEAMLRALQAQLNPHFLYNVLQSVSSMAEVREAPEIVTLARSLGSLLRYSIQSESLTATVREEVSHVEHYLLIQKIRFGERLHYQLNVPEYVMDCVLPRVFLQPMAENAIIHGLESQPEPGNLSIRIWQEDDFLHIEVSDDGCGILPEELERIYEQFRLTQIPNTETGIGLINLKSRLELFYGERAGLRIETEVGVGTSISITLPAERG